MRPQPAAIMCGTTAWQQSKVPVRLTAKMRCQTLRSDVEELLETVHPGTVDQNRGRPQLVDDVLDGGVDGGTVGDVRASARWRGHRRR